MCTCGAVAAQKSLCIDRAQLQLLHRCLIRRGTHALPRITAEYQRTKGVTGNMMELIPVFRLTSTACSLVWAAAVGNLLVHLSIDLDWSM